VTELKYTPSKWTFDIMNDPNNPKYMSGHDNVRSRALLYILISRLKYTGIQSEQILFVCDSVQKKKKYIDLLDSNSESLNAKVSYGDQYVSFLPNGGDVFFYALDDIHFSKASFLTVHTVIFDTTLDYHPQHSISIATRKIIDDNLLHEDDPRKHIIGLPDSYL